MIAWKNNIYEIDYINKQYRVLNKEVKEKKLYS